MYYNVHVIRTLLYLDTSMYKGLDHALAHLSFLDP